MDWMNDDLFYSILILLSFSWSAVKKICDIYDWDGKGELDMFFLGDVMYALGMNTTKKVKLTQWISSCATCSSITSTCLTCLIFSQTLRTYSKNSPSIHRQTLKELALVQIEMDCIFPFTNAGNTIFVDFLVCHGTIHSTSL